RDRGRTAHRNGDFPERGVFDPAAGPPGGLGRQRGHRAMKVNISVIQPRTFRLAEEHKNVQRALSYIDRAVERCAQIICFPEMYPGPAHPSSAYSSDELNARAKKHGVYIIKGRIQKEQDGVRPRHSVCADVIGPDGSTLGTYRRTEPLTGHVYRDVPA